jgi:hypothetical protein
MAGYGDIHADATGRLFVGTVRRASDGQDISGELVMLTHPSEATILRGGVALSNGIAAAADGASLLMGASPLNNSRNHKEENDEQDIS